MHTFVCFALLAGAAIAAQASMNAHLGRLLGNPAYATVVAFGVGLTFLVVLLALTRQAPNVAAVRAVPWYLWVSGGLLSSVALVGFYWLIPRMGMGPMMSAALTGQLLLAMLFSHFGWLDQPVASLTPVRLAGAGSLLLGVVLINRG